MLSLAQTYVGALDAGGLWPHDPPSDCLSCIRRDSHVACENNSEWSVAYVWHASRRAPWGREACSCNVVEYRTHLLMGYAMVWNCRTLTVRRMTPVRRPALRKACTCGVHNHLVFAHVCAVGDPRT